jgi:hypothetical protein
MEQIHNSGQSLLLEVDVAQIMIRAVDQEDQEEVQVLLLELRVQARQVREIMEARVQVVVTAKVGLQAEEAEAQNPTEDLRSFKILLREEMEAVVNQTI